MLMDDFYLQATPAISREELLKSFDPDSIFSRYTASPVSLDLQPVFFVVGMQARLIDFYSSVGRYWRERLKRGPAAEFDGRQGPLPPKKTRA